MPHLEVLVARAAPQAALPRRLLAPADAVGNPVHPIRWLFEGFQVRSGADIRSMLVRIVDNARWAEILEFFFRADVL